ncbi:type I pantothenate kinase [Boudabousia marimammalium]|uniref:Pantothenate kinase n=1 Tax=Boudabousia marimammalium TaxID=156892 RepID=A0A1Q5PJJ5_9ACTO|nr:type I pantothenate kinase [Boudabousia marimammalium]
MGDAESQLLESPGEHSPYESIPRETWSALASETPLPLTASEVQRLASLGDPIDLSEVDAIYRPLSRLIELSVEQQRVLAQSRRDFLHQPAQPQPPFIIGIAGSVAVGKSSIARVLQNLLSRFPDTPKVDLVTTDGFLYPTAELQRRGLMTRKGFPESYDREALISFLARVKSGEPRVEAPVYSHVIYDIVPDEKIVVERPDILIIEGINVLQPPRVSSEVYHPAVSVSDYFDFSIFIDANHADVEQWYVDRFLKLRETAFSDPTSYFKDYAKLSDEEAIAIAREIWVSINLVNFVQNIRPTRTRADLIISKASDHRVTEVLLRKL